MRVTQSQKPNSFHEIKIFNEMLNDQNDPSVLNRIDSRGDVGKNKDSSSTQDNKRLGRLRKQFIKKMQQMQKNHDQTIKTLEKRHQKQKVDLTDNYNRKIQEKQEYIQLLEEMVNGDSMLQTKKHKVHEQSKYVYTELSKNYVPNYQDISDRIDFKIAPRMLQKQGSLDTKKLCQNIRSKMQSFSTISSHKSNSASKHKLIPKGKPSEQQVTHEIIHFKLNNFTRNHQRNPKPFFI